MNDPMRLPADRVARITPERLLAYLEAKGWERRTGSFNPERVALYRHPDEAWVFPVPLWVGWGDYAERVADVIITIATVESRKAWEVLADLEGPRPVTCPHCGQTFDTPRQ